MTLIEVARHKRSSSRLDQLGLLTNGLELLLSIMLERRLTGQQVAGPLHTEPLATAQRGGVFGLGLIIPLLLRLARLVTGNRSPALTALAAICTLIGGYILRAVLVFAGNRSAQQPQDYFRFTQPADDQ
jgi:formate-dependent nitrite reductase membrane component NrfD